jgi:hypothetical protein
MVLALASGVVGGCLLESPKLSQPRTDAFRPMTSATPTTVLILDVAQIERPIGDVFLNRDLWVLGNEQGIDMELRPLLEENGLRICQIGGLIPARLQALLASPRSCPGPRRLQAELDQPTTVLVSPGHNQLAFQFHQAGSSRALELTDAHCFFEVLPSLESEQRIRLSFTPRIRHGKPEKEAQVTHDPDGSLRWTMEAREPIEDFRTLHWELIVDPGEYIVIGARLDKCDSVGTAYFLPQGPRGEIQKLLVIRPSLLVGEEWDEKSVSWLAP